MKCSTTTFLIFLHTDTDHNPFYKIMSEAKDQVPLNGAYYGPSIPPQQPHHPHNRRSRGRCVVITLLAVTISIVVALGIAALVFWLVVRPTELKFDVVNADLNQFELTSRNTVSYNFTLDIAVRNPNRRIGAYYDRLDAVASYKGERFGWTRMEPFYQGHKNTTGLRAIFQGRQQLMLLQGYEIDQFNQYRNSGYFDIEVEIHLRLGTKIGAIKSRRFRSDVDCDLRIPIASNATFTRGFITTRCDFDF